MLPLASADQSGVVAYVGTFSKVLAPALRIGYVVAPRALLASVVAHRLHIDVQGDRVLECALAHLIEQGEVQRHIRRVRREYAARRDVLVEALRRSLPDALSFDVPAGGIALWVRAAPGIDVDQWAERARRRGSRGGHGGELRGRRPAPALPAAGIRGPRPARARGGRPAPGRGARAARLRGRDHWPSRGFRSGSPAELPTWQ